MATELEQNVRGCGEILLRDGAAWSLPYSCRTSARLTTQLLSHNYRAIMERVLPELGIDVKTRRRKANLIYSDDGHALDADESMAINKGLAMELLVASMLTCLDAPTSVTSWCVQGTNGEPKLFAQGDTEDVLATYGDFRVVAEVSAKRQTSLEFLQGQLGQGIKHGVMRNEKGRRVADVRAARQRGVRGTGPRVPRPLQRCVACGREQGDLRIVPFWGPDFAELVSQLSEPEHPAGLSFTSATLKSALDRVYDRITSHDGYIPVGSMRETLLDGLAPPTTRPRPKSSGPSP